MNTEKKIFLTKLYHFSFIFIFTGYFEIIFLFGNFTLFYIDRLDNEQYLTISLEIFMEFGCLGKNLFFNGETEIYWLRRLFYLILAIIYF